MKIFTTPGPIIQKIDAHGRISIPVDFRDNLADGYAIIPGPDHSLYCYSAEAYNEIAESFIAKGNTPEGRIKQRAFFGSTVRGVLDSTNRVTLPSKLVKWAELDGEIAFIGSGQRFEIWSPSRYYDMNPDEFGSFIYEAL